MNNQLTELINELKKALEALPTDKISLIEQIRDALSEGTKSNENSLSNSIGNLYDKLNADDPSKYKDFIEVLRNMKEQAEGLRPNEVSKFIDTINSGIGGTVSGLESLNLILEVISKHPIIAFITLLITAFLLLKKVTTSLTNVFGLLKETFEFIGTSIAKIYTGAFQVVYEAYKNLNEIGNRLRKTINENVTRPLMETRENFDGLSKTGLAFSKIMDRSLGTLASFNDPTSKLSKLFGFGEGGLSAAIGFVSQNLESMGENASLFSNDILKSNKNIALFATAVKGMSLTGEDIKYWSIISRNNLKQINTTLGELAFNMKLVSKETGVDMKIMSKGFNELRRDIINFGHLSDEALLRTVARANQLGVQIKDMTSIFGKTDTIESTTQMVSQLSQAFGMSVDALTLLKSENPLEQIEMLRDSFLATGNSFNDLHFREKQLLSSITGLSGETMAAIMDYKNASKSIEEIKKSIEDDTPEQKQINAINQMTSSVKELIHVMTEFKDPLSAFIDGFTKKLFYSVPEVMKLSKSLENVYQQGLNVSTKSIRSLVEPFKPIINKFNEMTNLSGSMFSKIAEKAGLFFKNISSDWTKNGREFLNNSSQMITDIFTVTAQGSSTVLNTFHEIFLQITSYIVKAGMAIIPGLLSALNNALTSIRAAFNGGGRTPAFLEAMGLTTQNFTDFFNKIKDIWNGTDGQTGLKDNIASLIDPVIHYLRTKLSDLATFIGGIFAENLQEGFVLGMPSVARKLMGDEAFLEASAKFSKKIMEDADMLKRSSTFLDADYMQNIKAAHQQFLENNTNASETLKANIAAIVKDALKEVNINEDDYKSAMGYILQAQQKNSADGIRAAFEEGHFTNLNSRKDKSAIEAFDAYLKSLEQKEQNAQEVKAKTEQQAAQQAQEANAQAQKRQEEAERKRDVRTAEVVKEAVREGASQGVSAGLSSVKIETTMNLDNQAINILHRVINRANLNPYAIVNSPTTAAPGQTTSQTGNQ